MTGNLFLPVSGALVIWRGVVSQWGISSIGVPMFACNNVKTVGMSYIVQCNMDDFKQSPKRGEVYV